MTHTLTLIIKKSTRHLFLFGFINIIVTKQQIKAVLLCPLLEEAGSLHHTCPVAVFSLFAVS